MKKLIIICVALLLSGCANGFGTRIENAYKTLTAATVSTKAVTVAGNSFDALEATATNYLSLVKCNATNGPICRDPAATKAIIPAVRSARVARNNLEQFLVDHPGQLGPQGLYDAFQTSIQTLEDILNKYNVRVS